MEKKRRLYGFKDKKPKREETERSETNKLRSSLRQMQKENKRLRAENRDLKKVLEKNLRRIQDLSEHKTLEELLEEIKEENKFEDMADWEAEE